MNSIRGRAHLLPFFLLSLCCSWITGCNPSKPSESSVTNVPATNVAPSPPTQAAVATNVASAESDETRGVVNVQVEPKTKSLPPYNNVFVLCVGINSNPAYGSLRFAVNDATELAEVFRIKYGFDNVTLLTDTNADRQTLTNTIEAIRAKLSPDGKDDFIFLYAGHGDTWADGVIENGSTNITRHGFLITYDPAEKRPESLAELRARHLEMGPLAQQIASLPARHRIMFLDCCFSGLAFVQRELVNHRAEELYQDVIASPTVQIMTAGLDTEVAREDPRSGHGIFSEALLQQIRQDDVRTMEEVFFPLRVAVRSTLLEINQPGTMTPQHRYLVYTNGTFVFVPKSKRDTWATVRPSNTVVADAAARGYFRPVTFSEVTNLTVAANSQSPEQWQAEVERYEARAAMGDPYANVALSQIYGEGIGMPPNSQRAQLYQKESNDYLTAARSLNFASLLGIREPAIAAVLNKLVPINLPTASTRGFSLQGFSEGKIDINTVAAGTDLADVLRGGGDLGANGNGAATENEAEKKALPINLPFLNRPKAIVKIPFQGKDVEVDVEVKGFPMPKEAKAGMSAMQIGDYTNAVVELTAASEAKPKNATYHFALAVAMEMTGDYEGARKHYAEANKLTRGSGLSEAQNALRRLAERK